MPQDRVPVIDIAPFLSGDDETRDAVVAEVRDACEDIGFFTIVGHGVDNALIKELRTAARAFFALPRGKKDLSRPPPGVPRGFRAIGDEGLAYGAGGETPPDLKEVFHLGPPDFPADAYHTCVDAADHFIDNIYPDDGLLSMIDPESAKVVFYAQADPEAAKIAARLLTPQPEGGRRSKLKLSEGNFGRVPRVYIETLQDASVFIEL